MKREELIKRLKSLPSGIEVCIGDIRLNEREATGEPCGVGIYPDFSVEVVNNSENTFASLTFETHDQNVLDALNDTETTPPAHHHTN